MACNRSHRVEDRLSLVLQIALLVENGKFYTLITLIFLLIIDRRICTTVCIIPSYFLRF